MEDLNVSTQLTAGSDSHSSVSGSPNTASVVDTDKVINSKIDSTLFKGERCDEEFLKAFLTNTYCHLCSTQLKLESHRVTHYEGEKHAQKVQVFLEAARAEKPTGSKRAMPSDKNRFCRLCNMVFSSSVVAKSHYEGKVHAKNLRKQTLQQLAKHSLVQARENVVQKSVQEENVELHLDPTLTSTPPFPSASCGTDVDLKDPNKNCTLCFAVFNNPREALQHYNGRKHQKNEAREELLRELGDNVQQANSFMCHICCVTLSSLEMYRTHLQGNKHQNKMKKVSDLCKSQPKVYSTFADELADYIEEQKARGVTLKTIPVLLQEEKQTNDEKYELNQEEIITRNWEETAQSTLNPTQNHQLPPQPWPGAGHPSCVRPPGPFQSSNYTCLPLPLPGSGSTQFSSPPPTKEHYYTTCSSLTSESDDEKHRHREKRRTRRLKRDRGEKFGYEEMDTEGRRRKRRRREKYYNSEGKRRETSLELEEEWRKRLKSHSKERCKDTESEQEDCRTFRDRSQTETLQSEHRMTNGGGTPLNTQSEMNVAQWESAYNKSIKSKSKKEKKKSKEKDTRTEEEKLWDDSILGW